MYMGAVMAVRAILARFLCARARGQGRRVRRRDLDVAGGRLPEHAEFSRAGLDRGHDVAGDLLISLR